MRFTRKEHLITTVFNKDLTDEVEIASVFNNLNKHKIEFSVIIKKYSAVDYDYKNISFDKIRIKKIENQTVDLIVFKSGAKMHMKNIPFDDFVEINVVTKKNRIIDQDNDLSRFDILDVGDD